MRQMKQFVILLSAVLAFSSCVHKVQKEQQVKSIVHTNPLPVKFGDPYVLLASDGIYYMYGTGGGASTASVCIPLPTWPTGKPKDRYSGAMFRDHGESPTSGRRRCTNVVASSICCTVPIGKKIRLTNWKISVSEWPLQINRQDLSRNYSTNLCLIRAIRLSTGT